MRKLIAHYSLLIVLILTTSTLRAQHCNLCFTCCILFIAEYPNQDSLPLSKVYLVKANVPLLDINGDTIFLNSQKPPYIHSKHTFYDRTDLNATWLDLPLCDFKNEKYFVAFVQICDRKNLSICCEKKNDKSKMSIPLINSNFFMLCLRVFDHSDKDCLHFREEYITELNNSIIKIK